jgi:hypothetical protein
MRCKADDSPGIRDLRGKTASQEDFMYADNKGAEFQEEIDKLLNRTK